MEILDYNLCDELAFNNVNEINENIIFNNSELMILHVNIRSISKNIANLEALVNTFHNKPDIIICSEAWLKENNNFISIPGYVHFDNNSVINRNDGVILYIKKSLKFDTVSEVFNNLKTTSLIIQLTNNKIFKISGLYRCFDYEIESFLQDFKAFILNNRKVSNHLIMGDINIDLIKFDTKAEDYFYHLQQNGYQSLINTCTHPISGHNVGSCIDHIFMKGNYQASAGKIFYSITDHYPIVFSLHGNNIKCILREKFEINKKKFRSLCESENWNEILNLQNTEEALDLLIEKLQKINRISLKSTPKTQKPRNNWITPALVNSVNTKNNLYKAWKNDQSNNEKKFRFLNYEKLLKSLLRTAKNKYEQKHIQKSDSKKLWQYVHSKLDQKPKNRQIEIIKENNEIINDDFAKANIFNEFFSTIAEKLNGSSIPPVNLQEAPTIPFNQNSLFITPTNDTEVSRIIKQLKNKSGGCDDIHAFIIKLAAPYITPLLTHIINKAISEGNCPRQFKSADICPVHKNGSKTQVNNYRPIALISNLAKIFEKIIFNRLYNFAIKHKLISARQFGFLKNKSADDAIALLSKFIYDNLSISKPTVVAFLDYSKAFDTINHDVLLSKLYNMGIRGVCLSLIKTYLSDRTQVVKVNSTKSHPATTNVGVPQGSILGPLLFILYINDLLCLHQDLVAYADDTVVPINGQSWAHLAASMSLKLDSIYSWLYHNNLVLNVNKTVFVTFGNYRDSIPNEEEINIFINGQRLQRVDSCKYLGVVYDSNIKWNIHVNKIVNKTKYLVYIFYRLKHILSKKQLLQIYYGLFHSVAVYGIIGWGGLYDASLDPLDRLQKQILKIIGISEQDPDRPLNIRQVFALKSIVYQYSELKCEFMQNPRNTRFKSIKLPKHSLTIGQRCYTYYSKKYYNELPNDLKVLNCGYKSVNKKLKEELKKITVN